MGPWGARVFFSSGLYGQPEHCQVSKQGAIDVAISCFKFAHPKPGFPAADMAVMKPTTLANIFDKADTTEMLRDFILNDLKIISIADLIGYVAQDSYESEWKDIIAGAFPVRPAIVAKDAVAGAEGRVAQPAVEASPGFLIQDQRLLISRMRTTHRMALGVEKEDAEDKAAAKKEQYEADMEKPHRC